MSDLLADRPKLFKGLDQMLELLNTMTADGGAQDMAKGMRSMAQLAELLADPKGPLVETIDQLPALMAELRATTAATFPGPGAAGRSGDGFGGRLGRWARGAGSEDPRRPAGDAGGHREAQRAADDDRGVRPRAPLVGFAQSGLPELQGLIQDADRAVSELSRTVRDLRQDPERFLLGDPAAEGVKLQ